MVVSAGEAAARGFAGHHGLRLRDAGLSEGTGGLHVWLHAGAAAGHDFHAGAGSFAAAVAGLERAAGRRIVPVCPFVVAYIERHPSYADLVVSSLTKNIGGFGTDLGGVAIGPASFETSWLDFRKDFGGVLSARSAWPILVYGGPFAEALL